MWKINLFERAMRYDVILVLLHETSRWRRGSALRHGRRNDRIADPKKFTSRRVIYVHSCPVTPLEKRPRSGARASRERNFRRHAKKKKGLGSPGGEVGGTELEIDPWCSRWDAILFIVLIISEYIVRTRHDAPRSRIREIYAIETTARSPPPR